MKVTLFSRLIPVLGFTCALGLAPALAQVTATGTMAPVAAPVTPPAAVPAPPAPTAKLSTARLSTATLSTGVEFKTLTLAQAHCPNDTVVWSTLSKNHSFHISGSKYFGTTKRGAYVCKGDAVAAGFHQSKH